MHRHIRKLYTHPLYVIAFFVLVAGLSSSAAWLGDDGIFYVVFGAAIIVVVTPIALGKLAKQWKRTLSGSPSRLDYLAAPSGYRRARYAETEEEAIAQSIVVPTPNRPLLAEQRTQKSDSSVVTHLLDEDDAIQSSSNSPFLERKRLEFNPSQSTKLLDDPRSDALQSDPRFPKPQDFAQILERGFIPTRNSILLMNTVNGYATEAMSKLHHIGLAGSSGRGKTNLTRLIVAQLLACDAKVYMVNPNFAPIKHNGNRLEDWRPIAAKLQEPVARNAPEIATLLKYFMQIFKERREREQLTPKRGADIFLVLGEWPVIVEECPEAVKTIGRLLRQARQYGIHVLAEFQDALIETIKGNGGTRANYGTTFFFGGDFTTAKTLLNLPDGIKIDNTELGNLGAVYLKSFSSQAAPGRVPFFSNKALYMLLGFPDDEVTDELVDEDEFSEDEQEDEGLNEREQLYEDAMEAWSKGIRSIEKMQEYLELDFEETHALMNEMGELRLITWRNREDTDIYRKDISSHPETSKTLVPIMPDKGIRTDDLPTNTLVAIWNTLDEKTVDGLSSALSCNRNQSYKAYKRIKDCFNAALEEEE